MTKKDPSTPNNPEAKAFKGVESTAEASEVGAQSIASPQVEKNVLEKDSSQTNFSPLIEIALKELQSQRNELKEEIKQLSKRKSELEKEVTATFTGQSDAIARRVKGFQDYLTGALQGLAQSAEQLDLVVQPLVLQPSPLDKEKIHEKKDSLEQVAAISDTFKPDETLIRQCLEQFLGQPDFYADPWKIRRSLESRFQTLVLAGQPERLGEWRRGLQDALGLEREDFGPNSGIVLFERANGVLERADRLEELGEVPLILIDAAEQSVEIPVLQFPLWLAFAAEPQELYEEEDLI